MRFNSLRPSGLRCLTSTLSSLALVLGLAACDSSSGDDSSSSETGSEEGSGETGDPTPMPMATGAECDPASTLTYENFGQAFMDNYCLDCHDSSLPEGQRADAPIDVNFDTQLLVQQNAADIDSHSGASDAVVNELMPPMGTAVPLPMPTLQERRDLAVWIACGSL